MEFRRHSSSRRRHHVIVPAVLSLSRKHVDGYHRQIGDYWMSVSVNFLIGFTVGTVHAVAVHFRRLVNEFLGRNPIRLEPALHCVTAP